MQNDCEQKDERFRKASAEALIQDQTLSLLQKILLLTNGTVTDILKLYTGNRILAKKIQQEFVLSAGEEAFLCEEDTPILKREILLGNEDENFMYAKSIFIFENLPQIVQRELLKTDCPIGLLWKREKVEMYREVTDIRKEYCEDLVQYFGVASDTLFLSRTYLIYSNQKRLGVITEKFPIVFFRTP